MSKYDYKYIELIRLKNEDSTGWDIFISSSYIGGTYDTNNHTINFDNFKGTPYNGLLYPFKTQQDKGTWRAGNNIVGQISPLDADNYITMLNERRILIYPLMWVNDTPDPLYDYTLKNIPVAYSAVDNYQVCGLSNYKYFLLHNFFTNDKNWKIYLSGWQQDNNLFCKNVHDFVVHTDLHTAPWLTCKTKIGDDGTTRYFLLQMRMQRYMVDAWAYKKFRLQIANDTDFTEIYYENTYNFVYDFYDSYCYVANPIGAVEKEFFEPETGAIRYARIRAENTDGTIISDWTEYVTLDPHANQKTETTQILNPVGLIIRYNLLGSIRYTDDKIIVLYEKFTKNCDEPGPNGYTTQSDLIYDVYDITGNIIESNIIYTQVGNELSMPYPTLYLTDDYGMIPMLIQNDILYLAVVEDEYIEYPTSDPDLNIYDEYISLYALRVDLDTKKTDRVLVTQNYANDTSSGAEQVQQFILQRDGILLYTTKDNDGVIHGIYAWDWDTQNTVLTNLTNGLRYLSNTFTGKGFWFSFNDGIYKGTAFTGITNSFIRTFNPIGFKLLRKKEA